jgi:hypothetical protein
VQEIIFCLGQNTERDILRDLMRGQDFQNQGTFIGIFMSQRDRERDRERRERERARARVRSRARARARAREKEKEREKV